MHYVHIVHIFHDFQESNAQKKCKCEIFTVIRTMYNAAGLKLSQWNSMKLLTVNILGHCGPALITMERPGHPEKHFH